MSPEELLSDAEHIFSIAMCDPEFEGLMKNINHSRATDAVSEALRVLQTTPEPEVKLERIEFIDISSEVSSGGSFLIMLYSCTHPLNVIL